MLFVFTKLYQEYKRVNTWDPDERIVLYVTFVMQCLFFSLFIPIWELIRTYTNNDSRPIQLLIIILFSILIFTVGRKFIHRKLFKEKKMLQFVEQYKSYRISRFLLYLLSVALPLFLLLMGPTIAICLTGGEIFGTRVTELIH